MSGWRPAPGALESLPSGVQAFSRKAIRNTGGSPSNVAIVTAIYVSLPLRDSDSRTNMLIIVVAMHAKCPRSQAPMRVVRPSVGGDRAKAAKREVVSLGSCVEGLLVGVGSCIPCGEVRITSLVARAVLIAAQPRAAASDLHGFAQPPRSPRLPSRDQSRRIEESCRYCARSWVGAAGAAPTLNAHAPMSHSAARVWSL